MFRFMISRAVAFFAFAVLVLSLMASDANAFGRGPRQINIGAGTNASIRLGPFGGVRQINTFNGAGVGFAPVGFAPVGFSNGVQFQSFNSFGGFNGGFNNGFNAGVGFRGCNGFGCR